MANSELVVACDFGSSAFRVLVSEVGPAGAVAVLGGGVAPAAGFRDGDFIDLAAGKRAVERAVKAAEAAADVDISAFFYNLSGTHLRSLWARGQIQLGSTPRPVTAGDLELVLAKARSIVIPFDHCILAANPVDYAVDRVRGIVDPRGRLGSQLEVEAQLVTGSGSVVRNVDRAVRMAGYEVAGRVVDVLAAAEGLLTDEEREEGALLVDIGGRLTQWAAFRHGRIAGSGAVPWGGAHMTADLAHGLRIGLPEAEQAKRSRGVALCSLVEEADPRALFEDGSPEQTPGLMAAILEPRLEEIFTLVKKDLGDAPAPSTFGAGVILTGGGSRCRGTAALCEEVFDAPTRCRYLPAGLPGVERLGEGQWATALGLTLWAARGRGAPLSAAAGHDGEEAAGPLWRRLRGVFGRPGRRGSTGLAGEA